jgi:hypothetical protein
MQLLRRLGILSALILACAASIATTGPAPNAITGTEGPFNESLFSGDTVDVRVTAEVAADAPLLAGSGEVRVRVEVPVEGIALVNISIAPSDSPGDFNDTTLDAATQLSTEIGVLAFDDCPETTCTQSFDIRFGRSDVADAAFEFDWYVDGEVEVDAETGSGSLDFFVE